jgi:hypothetical protein
MKNYTVTVDAEFRSLIPTMSEDSLKMLEANIREYGLQDKLTLWENKGNYILIDGHNRHDILTRLAANPDTDDYRAYTDDDFRVLGLATLPDREAVKLWILENQVGRRNLTKEQRVEMIAQIVLLRQELTVKIKLANLRKGNVTPDAAPDVTEHVSSGERTVAAVAKEFNVPRDAVQKAVTQKKDFAPIPSQCPFCQEPPFPSKGAMKKHRDAAHAAEIEQQKQTKMAASPQKLAEEMTALFGNDGEVAWNRNTQSYTLRLFGLTDEEVLTYSRLYPHTVTPTNPTTPTQAEVVLDSELVEEAELVAA